VPDTEPVPELGTAEMEQVGALAGITVTVHWAVLPSLVTVTVLTPTPEYPTDKVLLPVPLVEVELEPGALQV